MPQHDFVTVYAFRHLDGGRDTGCHAKFKATRDAIREVHRGQLLGGTHEKVRPEALDNQGRYRRVPTGWGALD
jgi:hypothetical protein